MAMSKKDYELIAETIEYRLATALTPEVAEGVASVARELAGRFKGDNYRFRYDTFFKACGLDSWGNLVGDNVN